MKNESTYWLYAKKAREENLFRSLMPGIAGELHFPKIGKISYRFDETGRKPQLRCVNPSWKVSAYPDGEVIFRKSAKGVRLWWLAVPFILCVGFYKYFPKTPKRKELKLTLLNALQPVLTPIPTAAPTP